MFRWDGKLSVLTLFEGIRGIPVWVLKVMLLVRT